jgi:predicted HicB family RNase H-like nuclease
MSTMEYKGYTAHVEYDDSINEFVGSTVDMSDVLSFGGTNVEELEEGFHAVVDDYLKWCEEEGVTPEKPYQGKISLRIPPQLHRELEIVATDRGVSINAFIQEAITTVLDRGLVLLTKPERGRLAKR